MPVDAPTFTACLHSCVEGMHWLLLTEGALTPDELLQRWGRKFEKDLDLSLLGMKNSAEITKLLSQFPAAFEFEDEKKIFSAKLVTTQDSFHAKSEKVITFLFGRCLSYSGEQMPDEAPIETEPEPKKQKREPRSKLPDAQPEKEKKTESSSPSRTVKKGPPIEDDIDEEQKKEYLEEGAKVLLADGRECRISSAFPYLNQYWVKDMDGTDILEDDDGSGDIPVNLTFGINDLFVPESYLKKQFWECDTLQNAKLDLGSLCQVRSLSDESHKRIIWLDATILGINTRSGQPVYKVRIHSTPESQRVNYANRIGNNVPKEYIRWTPDRRKAARLILEFIDLEFQAMERDRTYDCDSAVAYYESAACKLALAEQNLSRKDDEDYLGIRNHRLEVVKRLRYLRRSVKAGTSVDRPLEEEIHTVQLSQSLHDVIREVRGTEVPPDQQFV